ncbi:hypothetical protein DUI87_06706 [Hirundo rustica rustica]|uniref:Uncharacterized protein n=1 Tax=Hirundo rustica rustica TaxID=333673 RepID=A0A3M0KSV6_HIRRU|nr:hypothetical protein DUI87_06706 [Hirundo rustica rustica]
MWTYWRKSSKGPLTQGDPPSGLGKGCVDVIYLDFQAFEGLECMELAAVNATIAGFWVRIKGQTMQMSSGDSARDASQDSGADELLFEELRDTSKSTALVLMRDSNLADASWEHRTAGTNRSRRLVEHLDDHFMIQVLRELARKDALLDLLLAKQRGSVKWRLVAIFATATMKKSGLQSVERRKSTSKTSALDMRRADFRLLRKSDEDSHLTSRDMDMAEMFRAFFASVLNANDGLRGPMCPEPEGSGSGNDQGNYPVPCKSIGPMEFI